MAHFIEKPRGTHNHRALCPDSNAGPVDFGVSGDLRANLRRYRSSKLDAVDQEWT